MPVLHPAEIWQQSGRWDGIAEMFKLKDRYDRDMCLGMTHEEVVAWLAAKRDPLVPRLATDLVPDPDQGTGRGAPAFRRPPDARVPDEGRLHARPRFRGARGVLQCPQGRLLPDLRSVRTPVCRRAVGSRHDGGSGSHEFMAPSAAGEDDVALCDGCGYAANVELARAVPSTPAAPDWQRGEVATPDVHTIAEVSAFLGIDPALTVKSLVFIADDAALLALVRGDHVLHERKLARALKRRRAPRARGGRGSPGRHARLGGTGRRARGDAHPGRRVAPWRPLRGRGQPRRVPPHGGGARNRFRVRVRRSAGGPGRRGLSPVRQAPAHRAGHRDRQHLQARDEVLHAPGAMYLDEQGQQQPIVMGSYGIGPARIAAGAIEQRHDADGIIWPWAIAPFQVHLVPVGAKDSALRRVLARRSTASFDRRASTCCSTIATSAPA